jgi:transposase
MSCAATLTPAKAPAGGSGSIPGWSGRTSTRPARATLPRLTCPRRSSRRPRWTQGAGSNYKDRTRQPGRESLGRSRGGLTTKIHLAADSRCRPIARITTAGHRHDSLAFTALLAAIRIRRRGPGRPRIRPGQVLADKAYSSRAIRAHLRRRRIRAVIPEPADQTRHRAARGRAGGRPPAFDAEDYRHRNTVERALNKLKNHRAVATRYDKRDYLYRGTIDVASIRIWLRDPVP